MLPRKSEKQGGGEFFYTIHWILLSNKKEWIIDAWTKVDGSQGHYAEWKKDDLKRPPTVRFHYITFSKWQNYRGGEQISGGKGLGMVDGRVGVTIKGGIFGVWNNSVSSMW